MTVTFGQSWGMFLKTFAMQHLVIWVVVLVAIIVTVPGMTTYFRLTKLLYSNKSRILTMIGMRRYVVSKWFKNIPVTAKVDVYSYGVMLLEIIRCKRSLEVDMDEVVEEEAILTYWASL
ncbi:hypothetical protein K1719_041566 [Acacia pycnantha]|nr:hypothetical protein K1719_041566 [Acacia pycnantha]